MGFWRRIKIGTLKTLRVKPVQGETTQTKISRVLTTIGATQEQRVGIGLILKEVQKQTDPKKDTRDLLAIALRRDLNKQIKRILGPKKSEKFFERYQDPYF